MAEPQTKHAAKLRAERIAKGLVERRIWIYPECAETLKKTANMLNRKIERKLNEE